MIEVKYSERSEPPSAHIAMEIQGAPGRVIRLQSSDSVQVLGLCGVSWGALGLGGGRVARRVSPCPAPAVARSIADVSRGKIIFRTFRSMRAAFVLFLRCACVLCVFPDPVCNYTLDFYLPQPGFSHPTGTPVRQHPHKCPALIALARDCKPLWKPRRQLFACPR